MASRHSKADMTQVKKPDMLLIDYPIH